MNGLMAIESKIILRISAKRLRANYTQNANNTSSSKDFK